MFGFFRFKKNQQYKNIKLKTIMRILKNVVEKNHSKKISEKDEEMLIMLESGICHPVTGFLWLSSPISDRERVWYLKYSDMFLKDLYQYATGVQEICNILNDHNIANDFIYQQLKMITKNSKHPIAPDFAYELLNNFDIGDASYMSYEQAKASKSFCDANTALITLIAHFSEENPDYSWYILIKVLEALIEIYKK